MPKKTHALLRGLAAISFALTACGGATPIPANLGRRYPLG